MFRINMEADGASGGAPVTPNPDVSPDVTQTTPSPVGVDALESALKRLEGLEGMVRSLQSGKDKGIVKQANEIQGIKEQVGRVLELVKEGKSQDAAIQIAEREARIDSLLAEHFGPESSPVSTPQPPGSGQGAANEVPPGFLESLGLVPNSADVVQVLRDTNDFVERVSRFTALAQKAKQAPPANPATVQVVGSGANASAEDDLDSVDRKLAELRSQPAYLMDRKAYDELYQKRMRLIKKQ